MDVQPGRDVAVDDDVRYLERLGYRQQLSRVMGIGRTSRSASPTCRRS
jgi:hypothetical protein